MNCVVRAKCLTTHNDTYIMQIIHLLKFIHLTINMTTIDQLNNKYDNFMYTSHLPEKGMPRSLPRHPVHRRCFGQYQVLSPARSSPPPFTDKTWLPLHVQSFGRKTTIKQFGLSKYLSSLSSPFRTNTHYKTASHSLNNHNKFRWSPPWLKVGTISCQVCLHNLQPSYIQ